MARTLTEISQAIKADFVANLTLQSVYGLDATMSFDDQVSRVSVEAVLIYVWSMAVFMHESYIDSKTAEIERNIASEYPFSIPWYSGISLAFQLGDSLAFDESTYKFSYPIIDATKQIIKFTTVRQRQIEGVTKLQIFATKATKAALTTDELAAFSSYITQRGAAGTHFQFISLAPEQLELNLTVYYDPQILKATGEKLSDGIKSVDTAINAYLDTIKYGGVFNRTRQTDAIQLADGVNDIILRDVKVNGDLNNDREFESASGFYVAQTINVTYIAS